MTDPQLRAMRARLQDEDPLRSVRAILRVSLDPTQAAALLEQRGVRVHHQYRLLPALAVEAPASLLLGILELPWVTSAEEDREVRALPEEETPE